MSKPVELTLVDTELASCVACGLCLPHCPTFRVSGEEALSPRGRIAAMRAAQWEGVAPGEDFVHSMETCVQCRGCETACPSGVQYGQIIGSYRRDMAKAGPAFPQLGWLQRQMLFRLTPYAGRMAWALAPMRLAQALGLRGVVDAMAGIMPSSLRGMHAIVPKRLAPHHGGLPEVMPAEGTRRARVARRVAPRVEHVAARVVERQRQAERAALLHLGHALQHLLARHVVHAPARIVGAELAPVRPRGPLLPALCHRESSRNSGG